jgi:hypothetical protein
MMLSDMVFSECKIHLHSGATVSGCAVGNSGRFGAILNANGIKVIGKSNV